MTTATKCAHDELIEQAEDGSGDKVGTCRKCGRVKRYPWDARGKAVIVTAGRPTLHPAEESGPLSEGWAALTKPEKTLWYEEHQPQIQADYEQSGWTKTQTLWGLSPSTLKKLIGEGKASKKIEEREPPRGPKAAQPSLRTIGEILASIESLERVRRVVGANEWIHGFVDGNIKALRWVLGQE